MSDRHNKQRNKDRNIHFHLPSTRNQRRSNPEIKKKENLAKVFNKNEKK